MFKVPVNNFSHVWTPHRERVSGKREWGRLNFLPRSNPHPNLHEVKQFLSCQQPITILVRINMTHFITYIQKHPSKNYSKCCSLTALNMYIILLSLIAPDYQSQL